MAGYLTIEQLEELKKDLPKAYYKTIAKAANVSQSFVVNTFRGEGRNFELVKKVIDEALKLRKKHLAEIDKLKKKVSK